MHDSSLSSKYISCKSNFTARVMKTLAVSKESDTLTMSS